MGCLTILQPLQAVPKCRIGPHCYRAHPTNGNDGARRGFTGSLRGARLGDAPSLLRRLLAVAAPLNTPAGANLAASR